MLITVYATPVPSVCLSVRLSVTPVDCTTRIKTAECIIEICSLSDRPIIIVFRHQGLLHKSDAFTRNGGVEYKGAAIFDQICGYILKTVIGGGLFTMEDEYKVVCVL